MGNQHHVLTQWKAQMSATIKLRFGDKYSDKEIEKYLDKQIEKNLNNRRVSLFNNYSNSSMRTTILDLIDTIEDNNLVITGGGCLFLPHGVKPNILIDFIIDKMDGRNKAKKDRKQYEKYSDEWNSFDLLQLNIKRLINSLYGCIGYPGFFLYNIFTAEAVTNEGRHIITTAINALDDFLGDNVPLMTSNELFKYIDNISFEYQNKYNGHLDVSIFKITNWEERVMNRLLDKCRFELSDQLKKILEDMICNMDEGLLALLYYKNNLIEFSQNQFIKDKLKFVIDHNGLLNFCELKLLKTDEIRDVLMEVWKFYDVFVLYDYPINDRIRKAMYLPKRRTLYTDTDSVFMGLSHYVKYIKEDVYHNINPFPDTPKDLRFTSVNIILIFVNMVLDRALHTLCASTNIPKEYADKLGMKNEFYNSRMLFVPKKKRYLSLSILQEGQLLGDGIGLPEIKGFEFMKSTTKPYLRDFYVNMSLEEILYPDEIVPSRIFKKMCNLKTDMEQSIRTGDMKFYKQSNVKSPEHYKNPYQTQGVTATLLWNALVPESQIELPSDVNIAPIKSMTCKKPKVDENRPTAMLTADPFSNKNIAWFAEKYPEVYANLEREIYGNINPLIRFMSLNSIAIPKNSNIEIPRYIYDLIDTDGIVTSALQLYLPIMDAIGLHSLPGKNNVEYMSNMIDL